MTDLYRVFVAEVVPAVTDGHPGSSPQYPGVAELPGPRARPGPALLGLHHRLVEPAQGGDAGGLAVLALPVVLRQGQELGTTDLNCFQNYPRKSIIRIGLTVFGVPHSKHLRDCETGVETENRMYCNVFQVIQPSGLISNTTLYIP